jgi:hypothetical protein
MPGDWIKMYRKSIDSAVFQSEGLWKVWCWCLMKAAYSERWVPMTTGRGETQVKLEKGQFIFGRNAAAKELKMRDGTVRSRMRRLVELGNIAMQPATHWSIVTICNYATYQEVDDSTIPANSPTNDQPNANQTPTNDQPNANQTPTNDQPNATYKKVKKDKKVKNEINTSSFSVLDDITYPDGLDTADVRQAISEWLDYKRVSKKPYKQPARQISKLLAEKWVTSPAVFVSAVDSSIARGYAGVYPSSANEPKLRPPLPPMKDRLPTDEELLRYNPYSPTGLDDPAS